MVIRIFTSNDVTTKHFYSIIWFVLDLLKSTIVPGPIYNFITFAGQKRNISPIPLACL